MGALNPDSRKAVKRRKEEKARRPERHAAGLGEEIETASLAPSSRNRVGQKRSRPQDEDEARGVCPPAHFTVAAYTLHARRSCSRAA